MIGARRKAAIFLHVATEQAIQKGLAKATVHGLTRPMDIAVAVMTALDDAGLKVTRKPRSRKWD